MADANIEIIVVNDGSTDKTEMIINEWQEKDERIVLVQQENKGLAVAKSVVFIDKEFFF